MRFILIVCLLMLVVGTAFAQTAPAKIALSLDNVDITQALTTLSQKANVSILGDPTVKGTVSCSLSDVTAEQALDTICKMNKLEWYKTYASANGGEQLSASKLFKLMDALKDLGGSAVICTDPKTQTQTVYVPGAKSVDTTPLATGLKLKEVYIVRAIPDPAKIQAEKDKAAKAASNLGNPAGTDPKTAAGQLLGYLQQMPFEQQMQTMHEMRHQYFDNMTPQQREQLRQYFQQNGGWRGPRDGQQGLQGTQGSGHNRNHND